MTSARKHTSDSGRRSARKASPTRDPFAVAFGERLRHAASAKGMTPYGLAGAIGHRWGETRPTTRISEYFNGAKLPRAGALRDLCNILGVSADWLLYGDGPMWRAAKRSGEASTVERGADGRDADGRGTVERDTGGIGRSRRERSGRQS